MPSRGSSQLPPLIAEFFPKRTEAKASAQVKRKFSEMDCDTMDLDVDGMSDDALGRFWGEHVHKHHPIQQPTHQPAPHSCFRAFRHHSQIEVPDSGRPDWSSPGAKYIKAPRKSWVVSRIGR